MASDKLTHWFAFSFMGDGLGGTPNTLGSVYIGYPDRKITMARLLEAKAGAKMTSAATVLGVSYLGRMHPDEFKDVMP